MIRILNYLNIILIFTCIFVLHFFFVRLKIQMDISWACYGNLFLFYIVNNFNFHFDVALFRMNGEDRKRVREREHSVQMKNDHNFTILFSLESFCMINGFTLYIRCAYTVNFFCFFSSDTLRICWKQFLHRFYFILSFSLSRPLNFTPLTVHSAVALCVWKTPSKFDHFTRYSTWRRTI